jgi:hypothetical protein
MTSLVLPATKLLLGIDFVDFNPKLFLSIFKSLLV